jgi:hypothetical protein
VPRFAAKLFFEGAVRRKYFEQFGVLLVLATISATAGSMGDSTATVIGAMIIAPLMTPIMATAAALVTGRMSRAGRSLLLVVVGAWRAHPATQNPISGASPADRVSSTSQSVQITPFYSLLSISRS